jgi:murein DD-endopeptidase MepM/ murein hydrolase activator NlpD
MAAGLARRLAVRWVALALAGSLGLILAPAAVFADSPPPVISAIASPSPNPSPTPSSSPSASPSATAAPTPAATSSPTTRPKDQLQNKEAQSQLIADLTASEAHALMLEKALNQSQLGLIALGQQILDSEKQVDQLDTRITTVNAQRAEVSARLQKDRAQLATVIRRLYKHQDNFFVSLIRAGGFGGFLQTIGYGDVLIDREHEMVRAVQADDVALAHTQTTLERSRVSKKSVLDRLVTARTALALAIGTEQDLQTQLQGTIDEGLTALDLMQTDTPDMAARRARLLKQKTESVLNQIEQAVFTADAFSNGVQVVAQDPVLLATGKLLVPVPHAKITQGFGPTSLTIEAGYAGFPHFHTGIDLGVPLGTPVFAAADGVVGLARPMTDASGMLVGYGNYIVIQHDTGLKTLYGHLLAIGVKEGDTVKRGQLIGLVGTTGNSTGPHTHFEVRIENSPVDPMQMLPLNVGAPTTATAN